MIWLRGGGTHTYTEDSTSQNAICVLFDYFTLHTHVTALEAVRHKPDEDIFIKSMAGPSPESQHDNHNSRNYPQLNQRKRNKVKMRIRRHYRC
jgi:hypothetical protein